MDDFIEALHEIESRTFTIWLTVLLASRSSKFETYLELVKAGQLEDRIDIKVVHRSIFFRGSDAGLFEPEFVMRAFKAGLEKEFLPEIEATDPVLFAKQSFPDMEALREDNWKALRTWRLHPEASEVESAIRDDDVDALKQLATEPGFDFNDCIESNINVFGQLTYVAYAAYSESFLCFKFLLINGARPCL